MVLSWKQKDTARAEKLREQARQAELKQQAAMVKAIVRELLKEQEKSRYPAGSPLDIGCDSNRPPTGGSALRTATTSTNALYVNSNGDWNNNNCSNSYGIRPALMEKRDE